MPDAPKTQPLLYLVDESAIRAQNDGTVAANVALQKHVKMVNRSIDFIDRALRFHPHGSNDELMVHRLAVRCLNSGGAALLLARSGYYNQCTSLIRDIMESALLLDLFQRDPAAVSQWRTASPEEQEKKFAPVKVRLRLEELDKQDGRGELRRDLTYKMLSTYGSHPSTQSFTLISPNMMTQIGPFPDAGRMKAMVEEITKHLVFAAVVFGGHLPNDNVEGMEMRLGFYKQVERWRDEFTGR